MGESWTAKAATVADAVVWIVKLNAWWWILTAAGLVVLGAGPATATAAILVRRRSNGEQVRFIDAARVYRSEFVAANLALTPALIAFGTLISNLFWFRAMPSASVLGALTLVAAILLGTVCCFLGPLYAYYDLPRSRYLLQAVRITLARPLWAVLMLLVCAATIFVGSKITIVVPIAAMGIWLQTTGWLGLRFFTENEDRRAAEAEVTGRQIDEPDFTLPTEPLRMH